MLTLTNQGVQLLTVALCGHGLGLIGGPTGSQGAPFDILQAHSYYENS